MITYLNKISYNTIKYVNYAQNVPKLFLRIQIYVVEVTEFKQGHRWVVNHLVEIFVKGLVCRILLVRSRLLGSQPLGS